jgi:hypothetical protein
MKPKFATIEAWCRLSFMSPRNTYRHLAWGNLRAFKVGRRTLIDVDHGLAWIRSLPTAKIKPQAPDKWPAQSAPPAHTANRRRQEPSARDEEPSARGAAPAEPAPPNARTANHRRQEPPARGAAAVA